MYNLWAFVRRKSRGLAVALSCLVLVWFAACVAMTVAFALLCRAFVFLPLQNLFCGVLVCCLVRQLDKLFGLARCSSVVSLYILLYCICIMYIWLMGIWTCTSL
jgi:hypothetical protein